MGGSIDCSILFLETTLTRIIRVCVRPTECRFTTSKLGVYPNDNPVLPDCSEFLFDIAALPRACEYTDLSRQQFTLYYPISKRIARQEHEELPTQRLTVFF